MGSFNEFLTTKGERLLAKSLSGEAKITFTKMIMGDGEISVSLQKNLTDVVHPVVTLNIESVELSADNVINVKSMFTNVNLTSGFYFREKGIYATDGTTEILFIYANNGSLAEWINEPTNSIIEKSISSILTFSISNQVNVTLKSGIYITQEEMDKSNIKIQGIESNISSIKSQLSETMTVIKNNIYPFKLGAFLTILHDQKTGVSKSYVEIQKNIEDLVTAKVDSYSICVEIQPSFEQQTSFLKGEIAQNDLVWKMYPSITELENWINYCYDKGLNLGNLKFHCLFAKNNSSLLDITSFIQTYSSVILNVLNILTHKPIHATILNEASNLVTTNTIPYIQTLLTNIKTLGVKTGMSGFSNVESNLISYIDNFYVHLYPTITQKSTEADFNDGLLGWNSSFINEKIIMNLRKKYPAIPIVIAEAGCSFYWEALGQPEKWYGAISGATYDVNGKPGAIFTDGAIKYFRDKNSISELNIFWTDTIPSELMNIFLNYREGK